MFYHRTAGIFKSPKRTRAPRIPVTAVRTPWAPRGEGARVCTSFYICDASAHYGNVQLNQYRGNNEVASGTRRKASCALALMEGRIRIRRQRRLAR